MCRVKDGILLLEVNRLLRAGGCFAWAAQPVYKHEALLEEQWEGNRTLKLCTTQESSLVYPRVKRSHLLGLSSVRQSLILELSVTHPISCPLL